MPEINNHDFFTPEHVASFLRNHRTGTDNLGRQRLAALIHRFNDPNTTVLDVACGTCVNYEVFRNFGARCKYTGLDRTKNFLAHARSLYGDSISLREGRIQEIPFIDNAFDVVIARHILEHLGEGYETAIKEVFRVAAKEAILVFFVDLSDSPEDIIKESEPDENGCTYFWNTYSHSKLFSFLSTLNCQIQLEYIRTPGAAANDTIVRLIK